MCKGKWCHINIFKYLKVFGAMFEIIQFWYHPTPEEVPKFPQAEILLSTLYEQKLKKKLQQKHIFSYIYKNIFDIHCTMATDLVFEKTILETCCIWLLFVRNSFKYICINQKYFWSYVSLVLLLWLYLIVNQICVCLPQLNNLICTTNSYII